jgi:hypothetical protein
MGCNQVSSGINGRRASKEERIKKSALTSHPLPSKNGLGHVFYRGQISGCARTFAGTSEGKYSLDYMYKRRTANNGLMFGSKRDHTWKRSPHVPRPRKQFSLLRPPDEPARELRKSGKKQCLSFSTTCGILCSLATLRLAKSAIAPTNSLYHESRFW